MCGIGGVLISAGREVDAAGLKRMGRRHRSARA